VVEIVRLESRYAHPAARVLTDAFENYPLLLRAFERAQKTPRAMMQEMFEWAMSYRLEANIPALIALKDGQVVGAATLRTPGDPPLPPSADEGWAQLEKQMNPAGIRLFEAYDRLQERLKPTPPPNYLVAIGVSPDQHRQGIARRLIEAAVVQYPETPLMLDTHDESNVRKYLALGFRLHAEAELMGMPNWYFIRNQ